MKHILSILLFGMITLESMAQYNFPIPSGCIPDSTFYAVGAFEESDEKDSLGNYQRIPKMSEFIVVDYDVDGNKKFEARYNDQLEEDRMSTYKYDENNNLMEMVEYDGDSIPIYLHTYKFSKDGKKTEERKYLFISAVIPNWSNIKNNSNHFEWLNRSNANIIEAHDFTYNEHGLLTKQTAREGTSESEKNTIIIAYTYGINDSLATKSTELNGKTVEVIEYSYSDHSFLSKKVKKDGNGNIQWHINIEYDNNGNEVLFKKHGSQNELLFHWQSEYNEKGLITKKTKYVKNKEDIKYTFEYDKCENLELQIKYVNGIKSEFISTTYTYF